MGPIGGLETSIRNYHYSLYKSSEEHSCHLPRGGSLKSRKCDAVSPIFFSLLPLVFFLFLLYSSHSTPLPPVPPLSSFRLCAVLPVRMNSTYLRLQQSDKTSRNTSFYSRHHNTLQQRFSNFFQVGTTFISQNVLRITLLFGLSKSLGLP